MDWITFDTIERLIKIISGFAAVAPGFQRLQEWAIKNPGRKDAQEILELSRDIYTEIGDDLTQLHTKLEDIQQRFHELGFDDQLSFEQNVKLASQFGKRGGSKQLKNIRTDLDEFEGKLNSLVKELESLLMCLGRNNEIRQAATAVMREKQRLNKIVDYSSKSVRQIFDELKDALHTIRLAYQQETEMV